MGIIDRAHRQTHPHGKAQLLLTVSIARPKGGTMAGHTKIECCRRCHWFTSNPVFIPTSVTYAACAPSTHPACAVGRRLVRLFVSRVHSGMKASTVLSFARGKGKTIAIKMVSSAGTGFFYTCRKNVVRTPDKLNLVKFDPVVRRRVIFKESKIK